MLSRTEPFVLQPLERDPLERSGRRQDLADQGLVVGKELGLEAEPARQRAEDVVVRPALAPRRNRRRVVHHVVMAVRAVDVDVLELRRGRQDDVGVVDGVGREQLVHHDEQVVALAGPSSTLAWLGATAAGLQL